MFVIDSLVLDQTAIEVGELNSSRVELLSTISAHDPKIEAIARLFQGELDTGGIDGQLYAESLTQVLLVHLLRQYCTFQPKMLHGTEGYTSPPSCFGVYSQLMQIGIISAGLGKLWAKAGHQVITG